MISLSIIAPYQTKFTIKTNCNKLASLLMLKHGKYAVFCDESQNNIITAIKHTDFYNVNFNSTSFTTNIPLRKIEDIMYENREYDENLFAIHGGAV